MCQKVGLRRSLRKKSDYVVHSPEGPPPVFAIHSGQGWLKNKIIMIIRIGTRVMTVLPGINKKNKAATNIILKIQH